MKLIFCVTTKLDGLKIHETAFENDSLNDYVKCSIGVGEKLFWTVNHESFLTIRII